MDKKELMSYLKDAYELEKQLYTLNQLKEEYETLYKVLGERTKTPLSKNEKFDKMLDKADYTFDSNYEFSHMPPIDGFDKFKRIKDLANIHTFFDIKDVEEYFRESWKNTPEYKKLMTAYKKEYKHNVKAVHWSGLGLFLFILTFILTYILTKQFIISLIISVIVVCIYNKFIDWNMDAYYALRSYVQKCYETAIDDRRTWCEEKNI